MWERERQNWAWVAYFLYMAYVFSLVDYREYGIWRVSDDHRTINMLYVYYMLLYVYSSMVTTWRVIVEKSIVNCPEPLPARQQRLCALQLHIIAKL